MTLTLLCVVWGSKEYGYYFPILSADLAEKFSRINFKFNKMLATSPLTETHYYHKKVMWLQALVNWLHNGLTIKHDT